MKLLNNIILLSLLVFVTSCSEEEEIIPSINNTITSVSDLTGTWNLIGMNSSEWSWSPEEEDCYTQSNIIMSDDGTGTFVSQFYVYDVNGDCTFSNIFGQVTFINATTLAYEDKNSDCSTQIITVNANATQIQKPICWYNDKGDSYFDGYLLYELQNN